MPLATPIGRFAAPAVKASIWAHGPAKRFAWKRPTQPPTQKIFSTKGHAVRTLTSVGALVLQPFQDR